jgi:CDP-glycerol glycerophosphotransferase (TagB/SpsB family)
MALMTYADLGRLESRIISMDVAEGVLTLHGWVGRQSSEQAALAIDDIEILLVGANGERAIRGATSENATVNARVVAESGNGHARGFTASFAPADLRHLTETPGVQYVAAIRVRSGPVWLQQPIATPTPGAAERARLVDLGRRGIVCFGWESGRGLVAFARRARPTMRQCRISNGCVRFVIELGLREAGAGRLLLSDAATGEAFEVPVRRRHPVSRLAEVTVATELLGESVAAADQPRIWRLHYVDSRGRRSRLVYGSSGPVRRSPSRSSECCPVPDRHGEVEIQVRSVHPWLIAASWTEDAELRVTVDYPAAKRPTAMTVSHRERHEVYTFPVSVNGDEVTAELRLGGIKKFGNRVPLRSGIWDLVLTTESGDVPVTHSGSIETLLPRTVEHRGREFTISDHERDRLVVEVGSELRVHERGKHHQRVLQSSARNQDDPIDEQGVLYLSCKGRQFTCNPAGAFAELYKRRPDSNHYVVIEDQQALVPEGAEPVAAGSAVYYKAYSTARHIVFNSLLPPWWRARPGQTTIQTWHGTPIKRIGLDQRKADAWNRERYERTVRERSEQWHYAVSGNPLTSRVLRSSLCFEGQVLEIGTPRNDKLFGAYAERAAARVRQRLRIGADRRIALYAPTWRDQVKHTTRGAKLELELDLDRLASDLGPEWIVLHRGHYFVVDRIAGRTSGDVVDVSDYPEAQDLLAASDVLVTDYSSIFVDFANTGKPMVFYPYDLDFYRDELRGFYVDYEETVPGPIVTDQGGLTDVLQSIDEVADAYSRKYKLFQAEYCAWEDGRASERLADFLLNEALRP